MRKTTLPPLGVPSGNLEPAARHDCLKELVNKLSWALGSTYRLPYTNRRSNVRQLAITLAVDVLDSQGFPTHADRP